MKHKITTLVLNQVDPNTLVIEEHQGTRCNKISIPKICVEETIYPLQRFLNGQSLLSYQAEACILADAVKEGQIK